MPRFIALVALACTLLSTAGHADEPSKLQKGQFVTQAMIQEGSAPELDVKGVGVFTFLKIDPGKTEGNCHVSLTSVRSLIEKGHQRGAFDLQPKQAVTIKMKTGECYDPAGNVVVCCKGEGSTCSVTVDTLTLY